MPEKKTAYDIVTERLRQTEHERRMLRSSISSSSEWQLAHNKGMYKAYRTLCDDFEEHGLVDMSQHTHKKESI